MCIINAVHECEMNVFNVLVLCLNVSPIKPRLLFPNLVGSLYILADCGGSVGRALDWGSKGCQFEPHRQQSHYVLSLSKILYLLLSTASTQEDPCQHD